MHAYTVESENNNPAHLVNFGCHYAPDSHLYRSTKVKEQYIYACLSHVQGQLNFKLSYHIFTPPNHWKTQIHSPQPMDKSKKKKKNQHTICRTNFHVNGLMVKRKETKGNILISNI